MRFILSISESSDGRTSTTIYDYSLKGKKLEDERITIDLSDEFYKGKEVSEEFVRDMIENIVPLTLIGEDAVNISLEKGIVDKENLIYVNDVPFIIILNS